MAIVLVLLALLVLLGAGGYIVISVLGIKAPGMGPTQSQITTTALPNDSVTYAGINITLLKIERADNFLDDPQSTSTGMLRLHMQEQNKTTTEISWDYLSAAHLLIAGKPERIGIVVASVRQRVVKRAPLCNEVVDSGRRWGRGM